MRGVLLGNSSERKHREAKILLPNARVASVYCRICYELCKILSIVPENR